MKRYIILLFVFLIASATSFAIAKNVLYLKNGNIIKGSVIEMIPEEYVKIKTADGSIFIYQMNEVDRIEDEIDKSEEVCNDYLKPGIRKFAELGLGVGNEHGIISASYILGRQINPLLFIGGGVTPSINEEYEFVLPIFCAVRFDFLNNYKSPFLDARMGYSVGENFGFYAYLGAGYRIKRLSISTGISCYTDDDYYAFGCVRIGYEF